MSALASRSHDWKCWQLEDFLFEEGIVLTRLRISDDSGHFLESYLVQGESPSELLLEVFQKLPKSKKYHGMQMRELFQLKKPGKEALNQIRKKYNKYNKLIKYQGRNSIGKILKISWA